MRRTAETTAARRRMEELRLSCEGEIRIQRERASLAASFFHQSLLSIRSMADETLANREKLVKLKDQLKELEADLGESLAVKTCKEAKYTAIADSLSTTTARTEELKNIVQDQKARRNEFAAVISQQSLALETLEEKSNQNMAEKESIDEVIRWYNRVLGFRTEGGEGVKFIFNKIDPKNPDVEYSFTIRIDSDIYTLLHCDPHLEDISQLVKDLNESNGLFEFVRIMRGLFQTAAMNGVQPTTTPVCPDPSSITVSSPPPTSVGSSSGTPTNQNDSHLRARRGRPKKDIRGCPKKDILSPSQQSVLDLRRSSRFKVDEFS